MNFKKILINPDSRCFFVGDLHGCYDVFMEKLKSINFDTSKDVVVSAGDLIDRGEKSLDCLRLLNEPWFHAVCGNHEDMAIDSVVNKCAHTKIMWVKHGGLWFYKLSDSDQLDAAEILAEKVTKLPFLIEVELASGEKIGVAHADIHIDMWSANKRNIESSEHLKNHVLWSGSRISSIQIMLTGQQGRCVDSFIEGINCMVFGHTALKESFCYKNCLWIDTGQYMEIN